MVCKGVDDRDAAWSYPRRPVRITTRKAEPVITYGVDVGIESDRICVSIVECGEQIAGHEVIGSVNRFPSSIAAEGSDTYPTVEFARLGAIKYGMVYVAAPCQQGTIMGETVCLGHFIAYVCYARSWRGMGRAPKG